MEEKGIFYCYFYLLLIFLIIKIVVIFYFYGQHLKSRKTLGKKKGYEKGLIDYCSKKMYSQQMILNTIMQLWLY